MEVAVAVIVFALTRLSLAPSNAAFFMFAKLPPSDPTLVLASVLHPPWPSRVLASVLHPASTSTSSPEDSTPDPDPDADPGKEVASTGGEGKGDMGGGLAGDGAVAVEFVDRALYA